MSERFTPGPWRVQTSERRRGNQTRFIAAGPADNEELVAVFSSHWPSEADLRLIAAAPELYEVVRELLAEFTPQHIDATCSTHTLGARIRAAIAKASGETFTDARSIAAAMQTLPVPSVSPDKEER